MTKSQHWQAIIEQWRDSGLTQTQFCTEQDIKLHNFYYWLKKQRLENEPDFGHADFIPVSVSTNSYQKVELWIGKAVLKFDLDTLPDVLAQLKQTGWLHASA